MFKESAYRTDELLVRDTTTRELGRLNAQPFEALQTLPLFMDRWTLDAQQKYGAERLLTATVNVTNGCPIGGKSFCGHYCFAHKSWNGSSVRLDTPERYRRDMQRLNELGVGVSIFLSTDTEPFPGKGTISDVTNALLQAMIEYPPHGVLIHSHTDTIGHPKYIPVMRDLAQRTNLIAGIGFETDTDAIANPLRGHYSPVQDRLHAFERMTSAGIRMQASVTPLVGFEDFEGFGQRFNDMGAYRVMVGELRKEFPVGGSERAKSLDLGLPVPTENQALEFFSGFGFEGGVGLREDFYVLLPVLESKDKRK